MDDDFLRLFGAPDQPPQAQPQEDDPFTRLFGTPPAPEEVVPEEPEENVFQRLFGALTQPQAVEEQAPLPAVSHGFPTSAGAEQAAAAGGTIPIPGGLEGQVGGVLPGMAEQFVDPGTPEVTIGEPTAVPQPQEGPTPMGARMEASKQKAMEALLADDARVRQVFRQELVDAGITDEEGQLAWTKAFMLGAQGSALPTLAQKAIEAMGGDPQRGYDLVRRMVEEGTVEPRAGVEMLGMMSAILADVAITRGIAGAIPGTSAARTAAQAMAGRRKVGVAEGILEGIGADALRAIQREDEGVLDVLIGAGLGGAFGAMLPGKAVADEALEGIRATLREQGSTAASREVAQAQGQQAAQGAFNEVVFRTADGEIIGKGMGANSHPELMFALTPEQTAKIADQGFADEAGNFKAGRGTPDAPIFEAEDLVPEADDVQRALPPAPEEPKLLAPPEPEGGRAAVRQPPVPEAEPIIRGAPEQIPAPPARQIPERTGTIVTPPPVDEVQRGIDFAKKEADRLRAERAAAEAEPLPLVEGTEQFVKEGEPFGFAFKPEVDGPTMEVAGRYNPETKTVTIGNVQGGRGEFGTKGVRQAFKEIRRQFPDATRIEGLRTTEGGITQGKQVSREIRPASNTPTVTPDDVPTMRAAADDPQIDLFRETISNKEGGFVPTFVLREAATPVAGAVIGGTAGSLLGTASSSSPPAPLVVAACSPPVERWPVQPRRSVTRPWATSAG
jgi:hypothetical protein